MVWEASNWKRLTSTRQCLPKGELSRTDMEMMPSKHYIGYNYTIASPIGNPLITELNVLAASDQLNSSSTNIYRWETILVASLTTAGIS